MKLNQALNNSSLKFNFFFFFPENGYNYKCDTKTIFCKNQEDFSG